MLNFENSKFDAIYLMVYLVEKRLCAWPVSHVYISINSFTHSTLRCAHSSLGFLSSLSMRPGASERAYIGRPGERNARAYCTNLIIYIYKVCLCCIRKQPGVQRRRRVGARFHYFVSKHRRAGAQKFPGNNIAMAFCPHPNHKHHQQC